MIFIRLLMIVLLATAFTKGLYAQQAGQTIRGVVLDEGSDSPVPYVSVVLPDTDPLIGTQTDSEGNFVLSGVPVGRYDIAISGMGYEPKRIREVLVSSVKEVVLTIRLQESVAVLDEVVISSEGDKNAVQNNMSTVSSHKLSVEEANRYAGGFDDPARLASSFAGVASNMGDNGITIRGNAPKFLQWRMEGVEIPNPNHFADLSSFGGGGLTALSSQMLANSDFFTGAFPAEYNNALSGVFDIFMRTGNNQKRESTLQLGMIGIDVSSEGPFSKKSPSSYLFNYRYSTLSLVAPLLPEDAEGTMYQDLSFKLNFPTKKAGTFSFWGIGLIDRSGSKAETDSSMWNYMQDMQEVDVKQYMGASGISHKIFIKDNAYIKTTLASTVTGLNFTTDRITQELSLSPENRINTTNGTLVLSSYLNTKFSPRHTNKSGIILTGLYYDMNLKNASAPDLPLQSIVDETGTSSLLSAYTSSSIRITDKFTMNTGVNAQLFTLNNQYTIEPRVGFSREFGRGIQLGIAYGLHSRLERLNYYFTRSQADPEQLINKDLDFTKAHHLVLSYDQALGKNMHLKVEPYYQKLFSVPVIPGTSYSFINLQNDWFFTEKLENTGEGRNYGLDITLKKYLSKGYYFNTTASLFNSEYKGGDGIWRDTRFNRNYLLSMLGGKEWMTGKQKQNMFGLNGRVIFQGGDRYTPVDITASHTLQDIILDESQAFATQRAPSFIAHFTVSYKINRAKVAHEIALKVMNATLYKEFYGFRYNFIRHSIDEEKEAIVIPNLSYKIQF